VRGTSAFGGGGWWGHRFLIEDALATDWEGGEGAKGSTIMGET